MNTFAVEHASLLSFRQALARNRIRFRLLAASGDLAACWITWFKRSSPESTHTQALRMRCQDGQRAEWVAEIDFPEETHYIKYFFTLSDGAQTLCYCERGFSESAPANGFFELLQVNECELPAAPRWAEGCCWYQIFPERFCNGNPGRAPRPCEPWDTAPTRENFLGGNLNGVREKLPYLQRLGVECLYLNPVFAGDFNHKYATTDYFRVDPDLGTEAELLALVEEAHRIGIRVVLDGVFNHVGIHFAPFADVLVHGRASRYADWFYLKQEPLRVDAACYECVGDYAYMPRMRCHHPEVRDYVLRVLLYWLEKAHIDGWRFDVADEIDLSAVRYWRERVKAQYPDALLLAETWGDAARWVSDGDAFDSAMNYLFRDAALDYFAHGTLTETAFAHRLDHMRMKYPEETCLRMYNLLGSHDTPRLLTECGGHKSLMKLALAFQYTFPGAPALYYGDEAGMTGGNDPGCRGGMPWDERADSELQGYVRDLIRLRRQHPALRHGSYRVLLCDDERRLFAFERTDGNETVRVLFNRGDAPQTLDATEWGGPVDSLPHSVQIVINQ